MASSKAWLSVVIIVVGVIAYYAIPFALNCTRICMTNCVLFTFQSQLECMDSCECDILVKIMPRKKPPLPQPFSHKSARYLDFPEVCPLGYVPTPTLEMKEQEVKQPNIFLFLLDDLDEIVSPYFEAMKFSKELFLMNGTRYTNAFSQTSICCPARCQILTGLMGHNTGVLENNGKHGGLEAFIKPYRKDDRLKDSEGRCYNNEDRTIAVFLKEYAKYRTHIVGKYLNGIENGDSNPTLDHVPPGWTDIDIASSHRFYNGHVYFMSNWTEGRDLVEYEFNGMEEKGYSTDVVARRVVNFIDRYRNSGDGNSKRRPPLFSYICTTAPHFPILPAYRHNHTMEYWVNQFDKYVSQRPSYYNRTEVMGKSKWLRESIEWRSQVEWFNRLEFAKRMGSLYAVDDMVKSVYDKIKEVGELDNTIFILSSDNGYNLGSHMLLHKMSPYDEASKVPLYISGPGFKKNHEVSDLVLLTDIAPTVLDLAGLKVPSDLLDTESLVATQRTPRDFVYLQYKEEHDPISYTMQAHENETVAAALISPPGFSQDPPPFKALRTHKFLYVCFYMVPGRKYDIKDNSELPIYGRDPTDVSNLERECELYDVMKDPYQLDNIAKKVDESLIKKLDEELEDISLCSGRQCYERKLNVSW